MRANLWPAAAALVAAVLVFLITAALIRFGTRFTGQPLADIANFSSVGVNVIVLLFGLLSLLVAAAAYRDTQQSGREQQRILNDPKTALDSSVAALKGVADQLNAQRTLLDNTLATSRKHLDLSQRVYEQEERRLARRPRIVIGIEGRPEGELRADIQLDQEGWGRIPFVFTNSGDLDLAGPVATFTAPDGFFVDRYNLRISRAGRNVLQWSSDRPIRCAELTKGGTRFLVEVRVPIGTVDPFPIRVRIVGDEVAVYQTFSFRRMWPGR